MLGYISSTRKKSCRACVKAKRRCDLGYPCCKRCFSKSLDCVYPNASVREAEVVIRQRTPDFVPVRPGDHDDLPSDLRPTLSELGGHVAILPIGTGDWSGGSGNGGSPESEESGIAEYHVGQDSTVEQVYWGRNQELQVSIPQLPQIWESSWLSKEQLMFTASRMQSFIPTLAFTGCNMFIHSALYKKYQPTAFQDSMSLSALYLAKTKKNAPILLKAIDEKIHGLIATGNGWTLQEHLAAVQALIVYQIIRLLDGDLSYQAADAARQNRLLEVWTAHLWKRSFAESSAFAKPWDGWVFYESLRRTVMMSVYLRAGWNAMTHSGYCDQVHVLARLPVTKDDGFWDMDEEEFDRRAAGVQCRNMLMEYGDYSLTWTPGDDLSKLTEYQRLLLAPCRGMDDVRLFMDET